MTRVRLRMMATGALAIAARAAPFGQYPVDQVSQFFIGRIDPTGFTMPDDYDCSPQLSQLGRYLSIARYFLSVYGPHKSTPLEKQIGVFFKSAGCIIVTDEPLDVSDPGGSVLISIKSMKGLPARSEIDAHCCRVFNGGTVFEPWMKKAFEPVDGYLGYLVAELSA